MLLPFLISAPIMLLPSCCHYWEKGFWNPSLCSYEPWDMTPIGVTMGSKEPCARSNVINESCQGLTSTHQYLMWAAEVFALHEVCCIDPPGSDHIALPVSPLSVNTRAKAFKLVTAIQKNREFERTKMFSKSSSSAIKAHVWLCFWELDVSVELKLPFKPPQRLQTSRCLQCKTSGRRSIELI